MKSKWLGNGDFDYTASDEITHSVSGLFGKMNIPLTTYTTDTKQEYLVFAVLRFQPSPSYVRLLCPSDKLLQHGYIDDFIDWSLMSLTDC